MVSVILQAFVGRNTVNCCKYQLQGALGSINDDGSAVK
jgi:hypothetical protein